MANATTSETEDESESLCDLAKALNDIDWKPSEQDSQSVQSWLEWCRKHPHLKCTEFEVPSQIFPKNFKGILTDVKVWSKKRVPDDAIYLAHQDLREKVARGNCVLEVLKRENGRYVSQFYTFLVFAMKKFSGGMGDEDDSNSSQSDWQPYFLKSVQQTKAVVSTEKANGEAAHISARHLFGETYYCFGSKNVHLLVSNEDEINLYKDSRFDFAKRVAKTFLRTYVHNQEISESMKLSFLTFVQKYKYTAVAELLQPENQHVQNLSYLKSSELRFISWTKSDIEEKVGGETSLCVLPVHEGIEIAKQFGIQTVEYEKVLGLNPSEKFEIDDLEDYMNKVRSEFGYEGKVLYFLDAENNTIGLIKKKTAWYILLRALREKVAGFQNAKSRPTVDDLCKRIEKRILQIQHWIGFSDSYTSNWTEISKAFAIWVCSKRIRKDIRGQFPVIFDEFLNDPANEKYKIMFESLSETF